MSKISIVAAMSRNVVMGDSVTNSMPWPRLNKDLNRFKELTTGHPVIMGRLTWLSFPEHLRPLPNRTCLVVSNDQRFAAAGAHKERSLHDAVHHAQSMPGGDEVFLIGGRRIFEEGLVFADCLYHTLINMDAVGDILFPEYEHQFPVVTDREMVEDKGIELMFTTRTRV